MGGRIVECGRTDGYIYTQYGQNFSGLTHKSCAKWKILGGTYSAIYGEVNVSVEKSVEIKGDYVEKQQIWFISVTLKSWSGRKLLDPTTYVEANIRFAQGCVKRLK